MTQEKKERKRNKQIKRLTSSAARIANDRSQRQGYINDLIGMWTDENLKRIVTELVNQGIEHLHIPMKAAKLYLEYLES